MDKGDKGSSAWRRTMEKTRQPTQAFRVKVIHGDYQKGRRHWFRVRVLSEDKIRARFEMKTEEGDSETLEMEAIVRFEQTTSGKFRVGDWMTHYLLPSSVSMLAASASLVDLQGMELASRNIRFVCTTENKYFCGEIARNGFRLAQALIQQTKQADTVASENCP